MAFTLGQMLGAMLASIFIVAVMSLVSAFMLQMAADESSKFTPTFGAAYRVSLWAGLIAAAICLALGFMVALSGKEFSVGGYTVLAAVAFFTNAIVLSKKLSHPEQGSIGFGRACWLTILQIFFAFMFFGAFMKLFEFMTK